MSRARQTGVSLVELMVSMVIGLFIMGALVASYVGTTRANRIALAQGEMNEDAQYALNLISKQIQQAGFNPRDPATGLRNPLPSDMPLLACSTGFDKPGELTKNLKCRAAATSAGHAIAVSYEADKFNTARTTAGLPTNCLGFGASESAGNFFAENRFYVEGRTLRCTALSGTSGAHSTASLVENVDRLEFEYGVASPTSDGTVVGYQTAEKLGLPDVASSAANWALVTTVRICIVMRSDKPVFDEPVLSRDCHANALPEADRDRYLRRAYTATATVRNRLPAPTP